MKKKLPGSDGEHHLQDACDTRRRAGAFYRNQVLECLNDTMVAFIAKQSMVFIATSDGRGECDSSFRAGTPGFVRILDDRHLYLPEYRGNGVMASLGNISENPHIGLMFIDFVDNTIGLHVNGKAAIRENDDLRLHPRRYAAMLKDTEETDGRAPERWIEVIVDEAYIHCSKHIPRLIPADKDIHWGTDDSRHKGGDFFGAKKTNRTARKSS